ncbi:MAG TPA: hypothetical protein VEA38_23660 [Terriglobales bacterium]|nr:hypothetical protein [Terriglobales bacterium]
MSRRLVLALALMLAGAACGSPAPAPPAPKATTAPAPAALDVKAPIDAAKGAAASATAATAARQEPGKPGTPPLVASPGAVAASAAAALTPTAPKYDAGGRRDPFESQETRLGSERSTVSTAKLTGVIHGGTTVLALIETADGIGYILKPGDTLADGRLVEIGVNTAVFSLAPRPGATTNRVVLKLAGD